MSWFPESKDRLPFTWWRGTPVFLAGVIAIGGVVCMIVTALLMGIFGAEPILNLGFSPAGFIRGLRLWTLFTYPFINLPSLWLLLTCYLLFSFGTEVEKHFGRWVFVQLLLWLMFAIPAILVVLHFAFGLNSGLLGITSIELGVFLAFATLYPRAQISIIILTLEVWILAVAFVGIGALSAIATREWGELVEILATAFVPFAFVRYQQGRDIVPFLSNWWKEKRSGLRVVKRPSAAASRTQNKGVINPREEVDTSLDKIAREGMGSLTDAEKAKLEEASKRMKGKRG